MTDILRSIQDEVEFEDENGPHGRLILTWSGRRLGPRVRIEPERPGGAALLRQVEEDYEYTDERRYNGTKERDDWMELLGGFMPRMF